MSRRGSGVASPNPCCSQILSQEEANIWLVLACQIQEGFDWLGQGLVKGRLWYNLMKYDLPLRPSGIKGATSFLAEAGSFIVRGAGGGAVAGLYMSITAQSTH